MMQFNSFTLQKMKRSPKGMTMIELLFVVGMIALLSGTIYKIVNQVQRSFIHSQNKLDILQATRIIMYGLRNELRNSVDKPQVFNDRLNIPVTATETVQYWFDEKQRRLYRGIKKSEINVGKDLDPATEMKAFGFDDGQILRFEYDSSYKDSNAFVESELTLNSKIWFKVTMTILYTDKFHLLSEAEKKKIETDPNDPRVKNFFMMITPRKVNWLLQATQ